MTDWSVPAWQREPHLLVGCYRWAVRLVDLSGVFTLTAIHAAICENVATGYRDHEVRECLDFMVERGDLGTVGTADLGIYCAGRSYPRSLEVQS